MRARLGNGGEEELPFSRKRLSAESGEGRGRSQCIMGNPQQHINEVAWDYPIHPLMKAVIGPTYGWAEIWRFILIFSSIFEPSQLLKHREHVSIAGKQCFSCSTSSLLKIRAVILRLRAEQWGFGFKLTLGVGLKTQVPSRTLTESMKCVWGWCGRVGGPGWQRCKSS